MFHRVQLRSLKELLNDLCSRLIGEIWKREKVVSLLLSAVCEEIPVVDLCLQVMIAC